ncbi:MAG: CBS domain-containing protein [Elusimicrobia bacterium]|nr:CBS domain-containing protein [Elusimicrobiota bacterium]
MKVKEIMTKSPSFCTPNTSLLAAARMMCEGDCGELPVLDSAQTMRPIGVITDRDITCRAVAQGKNPLTLRVEGCMSRPAVTVTAEVDVDDCCELLEQHQIRRVPVIDEKGRLCGIVSQADIARKVSAHKAGEVVREVSQTAV